MAWHTSFRIPISALLSLVMLTQLDGNPIWVESTQVVIVRNSLDCAHGKATALLIQTKALCVKETVDEVRKKIEQGNAIIPWGSQ